MAKHEPWYKPRDEDEDERLLEGFRRPQQPAQQSGQSGGICGLMVAAPVVGLVVLAIKIIRGGR